MYTPFTQNQPRRGALMIQKIQKSGSVSKQRFWICKIYQLVCYRVIPEPINRVKSAWRPNHGREIIFLGARYLARRSTVLAERSRGAC